MSTIKAAPATRLLKGKALDRLISNLYAKVGHGIQVPILDLSKIASAGRTAYVNETDAASASAAAEAAIVAAIAKYRVK